MTFALRFAEVNRSRMLDVVERAFARHTRAGRVERVVDVHHNFAALESYFEALRVREELGVPRPHRGAAVSLLWASVHRR